MIPPLECGVNSRLTDGCELKRQWIGKSITNTIGQFFSRSLKRFIITRRHTTHRHWCHSLICHLPILGLWTLLMIVILYKSIGSGGQYKETNAFVRHGHEPSDSSMSPRVDRLVYDVPSDRQDFSPKSTDRVSANQNEQVTLSNRTNVIESKQGLEQSQTSSIAQNYRLTSKKPITSEHSRQSEIMILLIQDEDLRSQIYAHRQRSHTDNKLSSNQQAFSNYRSMSQDDFGRHDIKVPSHIRHLTDVLISHKIGYTIETTRYGLPEALLSNEKLFSMIVIDNFVRYTKLSRWVRDQLDRHCRANNVGIMTFLMDDNRLLDRREILRSSHPQHETFESHIIQQRSTPGEANKSIGDIRSFGDQFPISYRILQQDCKNSSSNNCLLDHQLNEKAPIIRMLKRRPNFIVRGELSTNLDQTPHVIMSSNHVSYEPITWARLRQSRTRTARHATRTNTNHRGRVRFDDKRFGAVRDDNTQHENHAQVGVSARFKRAAFQAASSTDSSSQSGVNSESSNHLNDVEISENESDLPEPEGTQSADDSNDNYVMAPEFQVSEPQILSLFDRGLYDGIRRVIFGFSNNHWLYRMLLLDSIEHLSSGDIMSPLDRYIQIDIDDIFVGERGTRLNQSDVEAMIDKQREFSKIIDQFKFNLGFSGKFYQRGNELEKLGDQYLLKRANEFTWFCHFFSHAKAHLFNDTNLLAEEIRKNLQFARENKLPLIGYSHNQLLDFFETTGQIISFQLPPTYAVAPHHSGVYPIHDQLYDVWRTVLNVQVTSTEEYPHLRPVSGRRAFVHKAIKVLPRQTCGLYTHTVFKRKYPGGFSKLTSSINGGELFETVLHNPVNIYMTHMSNYANDRLALYTFTKLFDFVRHNTNLRLRYAPSRGNDSDTFQTHAEDSLGPNKLADYYFALNPDEREPLWTNPCNDKRHLAIWSSQKHYLCNQTPSILIVGPQKTGTTALYTFLKLNSQFQSSRISDQDYEEIQFLNEKHYYKGVDWYFKQFDPENSSLVGPDVRYFDKSATYFDDPKAARRAFALLPDAQIITVLSNPADRAYSWYQHMKAHNDIAANKLTFDQLLSWTDNDTSTLTTAQEDHKLDKAARSLRQRCLHPGYFASHLVNWLNYYPTKQVTIIDGEWFKYNPAAVMNKLQYILRAKHPIDYSRLLVYNEQKGFYCYRADVQHSDEVKCLGPSKGRRYPPMSRSARAYLNRHYWQQSIKFANLLYEIGQPLPAWLDELINH